MAGECIYEYIVLKNNNVLIKDKLKMENMNITTDSKYYYKTIIVFK